MKKWIYVIISVIIIILAIWAGINLFKEDGKEKQNTNNNGDFESNIVEENIANDVILNEVSVSSVEEEKVSPNAVLILKKVFEECGHTSKEYAQIPEEFVNLSEEELKEKYDGWELEKFDPNEIILTKQVVGTCDEHYLLKEKDGIIAVYKIDR